MNKILILGLLLLTGCSAGLSPELIAALSQDTASFCAVAGVRGGVGAIAGAPAGGYGQADLRFCRSNFSNSTVTLGVDGSISIQHNEGKADQTSE